MVSKPFTNLIRGRGFFRSYAEAADFSGILLNFRIFAAQISVRQNCHCRNLDAELIDFIKRNGSGGKLVKGGDGDGKMSLDEGNSR